MDSIKEELMQKMNAVVDSYFKPTFVRPPPPASLPINFVVDVYAKWIGQDPVLVCKIPVAGQC